MRGDVSRCNITIQTDRQTDRQTDKQTDRQTDRQTDKTTYLPVFAALAFPAFICAATAAAFERD
jgi:hypothetical protein